MSYLYDKSFAIMKCNSWEEKVAVESIFSAVEKMINELVPQIVEKYINEHKEKLLIEIDTVLNGKTINPNNINSAIREAILRQLNN